MVEHTEETNELSLSTFLSALLPPSLHPSLPSGPIPILSSEEKNMIGLD